MLALVWFSSSFKCLRSTCIITTSHIISGLDFFLEYDKDKHHEEQTSPIHFQLYATVSALLHNKCQSPRTMTCYLNTQITLFIQKCVL